LVNPSKKKKKKKGGGAAGIAVPQPQAVPQDAQDVPAKKDKPPWLSILLAVLASGGLFSLVVHYLQRTDKEFERLAGQHAEWAKTAADPRKLDLAQLKQLVVSGEVRPDRRRRYSLPAGRGPTLTVHGPISFEQR
jgi:hypothetical protein